MFQKIFSRKIFLLSAMTTGVLIALISYEHFGSDNIAECRLKKTYDLQIKCFTDLANTGNADAQYALGEIYQDGLSVKQNETQAAYWLQKAAKQGDATAQFNLGTLYISEQGGEQDINKGIELWQNAIKTWEKAAEQGDAEAENHLGVLYEKGLGVEQDYSKAAYYYQKSAEQGFPMAQLNLGTLYVSGQGVRQDQNKAEELFKKAAKNGNAITQLTLGILYYNGKVVKQDQNKAEELFKKAAEYGDNTTSHIARFYENIFCKEYKDNYNSDYSYQDILNHNETNVYSDNITLKKAVYWWRKSSDRKDAESQYNLGIAYKYGGGVMSNPKQAKEYFGKACDNGEEDGCREYARLNERGVK